MQFSFYLNRGKVQVNVLHNARYCPVTFETVKETSIVFVKNDRFLFLMMETSEKTGQKKLSRIGLIAILGLAGFVSAADNWVVSALLPAIAADFNATIVKTAGILTAYLIPYGFMQPVYGFFSDRWGKSTVLKVVMTGLLLATVGCVLATSLTQLIFWRFLAGFFAAGIIAVSLALIGDEVFPAERSQSVGLFMGMVFLGQGISSAFGGFFAGWVNWRLTFLCLIVIGFVALLLFTRLPSGLRSCSGNAFFTETTFVLLSPKGKIVFPMAFLTGFLMLGAYSYIGAYLHEAADATYPVVGLIMMGYGCSSFITGYRLGWITERFSAHVMLMLGASVAACALVALALFPTLATGVLAVLILGMSYIFMQSTLATQAFTISERNKGLPSALVGLGLFGGGGVGTWVGGMLLAAGGYPLLWSLITLALCLVVLLSRSSRGKSLDV